MTFLITLYKICHSYFFTFAFTVNNVNTIRLVCVSFLVYVLTGTNLPVLDTGPDTMRLIMNERPIKIYLCVCCTYGKTTHVLVTDPLNPHTRNINKKFSQKNPSHFFSQKPLKRAAFSRSKFFFFRNFLFYGFGLS